MASKKQRRRQQKERRHEYEYVYVDAEGQEVEVEEPEQAAGKTSSKAAPVRGRAGRAIDPPSWRRSIRRALIFAPFMMLFLYILDSDQGIAPAITSGIVLIAFFVPFSYFMDAMLYRMARKRADRGRGAKGREAQ